MEGVVISLSPQAYSLLVFLVQFRLLQCCFLDLQLIQIPCILFLPWLSFVTLNCFCTCVESLFAYDVFMYCTLNFITNLFH